MPVTLPPTAPTLADPQEVSEPRMYDMVNWYGVAVPQMNALEINVNAKEASAVSAAASAIAAANFKGDWASLSGALNVPASVYYNGTVWLLLSNLANVAAATPGISAAWLKVGGTTPPTINGGAVSGMKNRCINGMMEVSQRGDFTTASASVSGAYYLDRWYTDHIIACNKQQTTGNSIPNLGTSCKAFKLIATASGTGVIGFVQLYEWFSELGGKQVTLSAYVKSNSANARVFFYCATTSQVIVSSPHSGGGGWEKLTAYATVSAGLTQFRMMFYIAQANTGTLAITSGDYIEATGVSCKDGDCRNELYNEWRPYTIEEMLCRRYLPVTDDYNLPGQAYGTNAAMYHATFKVPARVAPTGIQLSAALSNYNVTNAAYSMTALTGGALNFNNAAIGGGTLTAVPASSPFVAGNATTLNLASASKILWTGCEL